MSVIVESMGWATGALQYPLCSAWYHSTCACCLLPLTGHLVQLCREHWDDDIDLDELTRLPGK